jgi:hypothetical protein
MIRSDQIRAARAALGWTAAELSAHAHIGLRTLLRIEANDGVPQTTTSTLLKIQTTLEAAGIEFIGTPDNAPGIRIHPPRSPAD